MSRAKSRLAIIAVVFALLVAAALWSMGRGDRFGAQLKPVERAELGLLTTLPIYWGEAADLGDMLQGDEKPSWVRAALERRFELVPLDTLDGLTAPDGPALEYLLLAQPRALSPGENVALDEWVRGGGRLLLLADPMLTGHSRFGIGDRRRPQDVVLLSPILARWGLELTFDESQPAGERAVALLDGEVPVNLAGRFRLAPQASEAPGDCRLDGKGVLADCMIGEGRVLAFADAALTEEAEGDGFEARLEALALLEKRAFQ